MVKVFFILFLIPAVLFSQNPSANYFEYQVFKLQKTKEVKNTLLRDLIEKGSDTIEFKLQKQDSVSYFSPIYKINNSQSEKIRLSEVFKKSHGEYYIDETTEKVFNEKEYGGKKYVIETRFDEIKWDITDEIDTINGYICRKAVYKKIDYGLRKNKEYIIEAWFDDRHEVNIAPFGLVGLNGIIVKINFNNASIAILSNSLHKEKIKIKPFKNKNIISANEYDNMIKQFIIDYRKRNSIPIENLE